MDTGGCRKGSTCIFIILNDCLKYDRQLFSKVISTVQFYETENGERPVREFLLSLDVKMKAKLTGLLNVLSEKENDLREPYSKPLGDGIFELRGQVGNNISRVLYFLYYGGRIIVTNGFIKKTQKTPRKQIKIAKERRKDYIERMEK